jgi:hypothetical protein
VFTRDQARERSQAADADYDSHETADPVTYRSGHEKNADSEAGYSTAETPRAVRLRVRLVSRNPILPPLSSTVSWRVRVDFSRSLDDPAEVVYPLAGSYFRAVGVHTLVDGCEIRWESPVHHRRKVYIEVQATICPVGIVGDQAYRAVPPP